MPRYLSVVLTALGVAGLALPAAATRVVVPDDLPTIQTAVDSGTDTVSVRDGLAPERLTVTRFVVIEPAPRPLSGLGHWTATPLIRSLNVTWQTGSFGSPGVEVRGFRFLGEVNATTTNVGQVNFEGCRFDSGLAGPAGTGSPFAVSRVRGCIFIGNVSLTGYVQFVGNTVIGGTASIWCDGLHDIQNNYIQGPAENGMRLSLQLSTGEVAMNTVRGTINGIRFDTVEGGTTTLKNDVADCTGDGIVYAPTTSFPGSFRCDSNSVARCGGAGIIIRNTSEYWSYAGGSGNVVRQTGLGGIDLGGSIVPEARGNIVLDAGGDGFTASLADSFENNVIGRCGGAGLRLTVEPWRVVGNTIFSNAGPGMHFSGETISTNQVTHNVSAFNGGPGLLYECTGVPQMGCNDWFGNVGGPTVGISPDATDLFLNPLFCDLGSGDVHLAAGSPLLAAPGCGLIGALGQGCDATTAVEEARRDDPRGFHAWPVPARGAVGFALPIAASSGELEIFDVTGARRWQSAIPAGATRLEWDRRETGGQMVAPGVYFARLRREGAEVATARIVLTE